MYRTEIVHQRTTSTHHKLVLHPLPPPQLELERLIAVPHTQFFPTHPEPEPRSFILNVRISSAFLPVSRSPTTLMPTQAATADQMRGQ